MEQNQWIDKSFPTLITDAIENIYLAKALPNPGTVGRCSRFAIMSCAFSIESVANICFSELPLTWDFISNLERKLNVLDKYELFLLGLHGKKVMNRGCHEVQRINELIESRSEYVHPKMTALPVISSVKDHERNQFTVSCGSYNHLKIDKSYRTWKGDDGVRVLRSVEDFLNLCFLEWCKLEPRKVTDMLSSKLIIGDRRILSPTAGEVPMFEKAKEWGIEFRFLDFELLNNSGKMD